MIHRCVMSPKILLHWNVNLKFIGSYTIIYECVMTTENITDMYGIMYGLVFYEDILAVPNSILDYFTAFWTILLPTN